MGLLGGTNPAVVKSMETHCRGYHSLKTPSTGSPVSGSTACVDPSLRVKIKGGLIVVTSPVSRTGSTSAHAAECAVSPETVRCPEAADTNTAQRVESAIGSASQGCASVADRRPAASVCSARAYRVARRPAPGVLVMAHPW
jgi:hypothetical protein